MTRTFNITLREALRSPLTSRDDLAQLDRAALIEDRPKIALAARREIERRDGADEDDEPWPGDGCLACGRLSCDCDQRYDEARERDDG